MKLVHYQQRISEKEEKQDEEATIRHAQISSAYSEHQNFTYKDLIVAGKNHLAHTTPQTGLEESKPLIHSLNLLQMTYLLGKPQEKLEKIIRARAGTLQKSLRLPVKISDYEATTFFKIYSIVYAFLLGPTSYVLLKCIAETTTIPLFEQLSFSLFS